MAGDAVKTMRGNAMSSQYGYSMRGGAKRKGAVGAAYPKTGGSHRTRAIQKQLRGGGKAVVGSAYPMHGSHNPGMGMKSSSY